MKKPKRRADGRYVAVYKQHYFYGHSPEEADAKREAYRQKTERSLHYDTVREYAVEWLPINRQQVAPKTMELYKSFVDIISEYIGERAFSDVKPSDIKRIYSVRFASASDSHIRHFRNLITAIFDSAVEDGYIPYNPCRSKKAAPHRGTAGTHRQITPEERQLILSTEARLRPVVMTMLYAGLRDSEALALDVGRDVDFEAGIIHVRQFRHVNRNSVWTSDTGKTPAAVRDVPLLPELARVLKQIPGLLATGRDGKILTTSGWRSAWRVYINDLEVSLNGCRHRWYGKRSIDQEHPPDPWKPVTIRPYDLRHSYCCMCRDAGVDPNVLRLWLGHSDISMIMRVYDHVSDDRVRNEIKKLSNGPPNGQNDGQTDPTNSQKP